MYILLYFQFASLFIIILRKQEPVALFYAKLSRHYAKFSRHQTFLSLSVVMKLSNRNINILNCLAVSYI